MSSVSSVIGTWSVTTNGFSGQLQITSVDGQGNLRGTLTIDKNDQGSPTGEAATPVTGFFNEAAQEVFFVRDMRNIHPNDPLPFQVYTAYSYANFHGDLTETLAGVFEAIVNAERHRFGWVGSRMIVG